MAIVKKNIVTEGLSGKLATPGRHSASCNWVYTTQKANANVKGTHLRISASDLPGNKTEREEVLA